MTIELEKKIREEFKQANHCGYKPDVDAIISALKANDTEIIAALKEAHWFMRNKYWPQPTGILYRIERLMKVMG